MVSEPGVEQEIPASQLTRDALEKHWNENAGNVTDPDTFHGGWHDPQSGNAYLDISRQYDDPNEAMDAGRRNGQLAIYDFKAGKSIPVPDTSHAKAIFGSSWTIQG
jgi:hypothetical protein